MREAGKGAGIEGENLAWPSAPGPRPSAGGSTFCAGRLLPLGLAAALLLGGCGTAPKRSPEAMEPPSGGAPTRGGYYLDDGPGENPPPDLEAIPDPVPRPEPIRAANARPYEAMGRTYIPMTEPRPFKQRGIASWYGRRYHGRPTASGEPYNMYAMTAAHPTLPIPSYARVTHLGNGRSVVVRINDRGPFLSERIIDLSYTAAYKLDMVEAGSAWVEVEALLPGTLPAAQPPQESASVPGAGPGAASLPASAADGAPKGAPPVTPGYYLQLGAFGSRENAEAFLDRLQGELAWLADALRLAFHERLYRVQAGPYPDAASAREAAGRIASTLNLRPLIVSR
jgi:rare lipoprotein A